jgi:ubiquinone/menaquinone biosynthesis C-methylase UbiE
MPTSPPPAGPLPHRLRYPALLVFLLGGMLGSGLNFAVTLGLHFLLGMFTFTAFFVGTLANELFHHLYYHVVYVNQEIRLRTPLRLQLSMYIIVAALAAGLLWVVQRFTGLSFVPSVAISLVILAVLNTVINRVSTFSSAQLAMVEYQEMGQTFYDDQTDPKKVNWFRAWFHRSRYQRLTQFVDAYFKPGIAIADLGCGNCWWNANKYPVIGVDVNENMLKWAKQQGRLIDYHVTADLSKTGLEDNSLDIVIMSETLEHLLNLDETILEVRRILKDNGVFLITVPYDFFLGPFFILFNVNCLWQGYVRGSAYHRYRCGHINHFTKQRLRAALRENGFASEKMFIVNGMSLYAAARKVADVKTDAGL